MGFTRLKSDPCVYICHIPGTGVIVITVHVDDMSMYASNKQLIQDTQDQMRLHFEITVLGEAKQLLGMEI